MEGKLDFSQVEEHCKFTLSANEIRDFCDCPRKRYYGSRDCLAIRETSKNSNLVLGDAFHRAIAYYYLSAQKLINDAPTYKEVENIVMSLPDWESPEDLELGKDDKATFDAMLTFYTDTMIKDLVKYRFIAAEQAFHLSNWPVKDVLYHGFIDLVVQDREDGKYYFFENKTCKNFRPEIYSRFDIQLHIYDVYGHQEFGEEWGGMLLNQIKKAKTILGYGEARDLYAYSDQERSDFTEWLKAKTEALISPNNMHAPCNSFMSCKICSYMAICMKYGYQVPKTHEEITDSVFFTELDAGNNKVPLFRYDPRIDESEGDK